jgi:hypothetical protein
MAKYYIGERLVEDGEGIPVLDEDGQEINVLPEEFEYLGMPGRDMFRWSPTAFDKQAGQGED